RTRAGGLRFATGTATEKEPAQERHAGLDRDVCRSGHAAADVLYSAAVLRRNGCGKVPGHGQLHGAGLWFQQRGGGGRGWLSHYPGGIGSRVAAGAVGIVATTTGVYR